MCCLIECAVIFLKFRADIKEFDGFRNAQYSLPIVEALKEGHDIFSLCSRFSFW